MKYVDSLSLYSSFQNKAFKEYLLQVSDSSNNLASLLVFLWH